MPYDLEEEGGVDKIAGIIEKVIIPSMSWNRCVTDTDTKGCKHTYTCPASDIHVPYAHSQLILKKHSDEHNNPMSHSSLSNTLLHHVSLL